MRVGFLLLSLLSACSSSTFTPDGSSVDSSVVNKAARCSATFGNELTASFGRADGTVLAVVSPSDTQCPIPNDDHVVLQITMQGAVYRMVINVASYPPTPDVFLAEIDAPLPGEPWAEGWHTNVSLDYPSTLGLHAAAFTSYAMNDLVAKLLDEIQLDDAVAVFAQSSGGSSAGSAHLIHRNGHNLDGAVVLKANSASPHFLLFRFADQTF